MEACTVEWKAEIIGVAVDHRQIVVLAALVEAEPEAEAIGQRHLFLDCLRRVDCGRLLVFHHVAGQQMATVRSRVEEHVVRASLDASVKGGFQGFVGCIVVVEGEVVAKDDDPVVHILQDVQ